jgi:hypothetical protein
MNCVAKDARPAPTRKEESRCHKLEPPPLLDEEKDRLFVCGKVSKWRHECVRTYIKEEIRAALHAFYIRTDAARKECRLAANRRIASDDAVMENNIMAFEAVATFFRAGTIYLFQTQ